MLEAADDPSPAWQSIADLNADCSHYLPSPDWCKLQP